MSLSKLNPGQLEDFSRSIAEVHDELALVVFNEKRGHAGTEIELALTTAEADLASAREQIGFIQQKLAGK